MRFGASVTDVHAGKNPRKVRDSKRVLGEPVAREPVPSSNFQNQHDP
jgi:hypothetical protein